MKKVFIRKCSTDHYNVYSSYFYKKKPRVKRPKYVLQQNMIPCLDHVIRSDTDVAQISEQSTLS